MDRTRAARLRERLFRITVAVKGVDGLLEFAAGAALLAIKPDFIMRTIAFLTQDDLSDDPRDFVARLLQNFAEHFSVHTQHFASFYLLIHGMVKMLLVVALLRNRLTVYPWAMAVFALLIAYQCYRFTYTHSVMLLVLSAFDATVIWLIWLEYRSKMRPAVAA
jgi:uncharacterized membrane protein